MRKSYRVKKEAEFQKVFTKAEAAAFSRRNFRRQKDRQCGCEKLGQASDSPKLDGVETAAEARL